MKVIIMTDLEGVAGVANAKDYIYFDSRWYDRACALATLEVSAAVEGALEAGATDVLVVDAHGPGAMRAELLHPKAKLLTGRPWAREVVWGLDDTYDVALIIGQHAKANTDGGHLAHTQAFVIEDQRINGVSLGELGEWMLYTGHFHIPMVMMSGDAAACEEGRALMPNIETAAVKWGFKRGSASGLTKDENEGFNSVATHLSPDEARTLIREKARRGILRRQEITPFTMEPPYKLEYVLRPKKSGGKPSVRIGQADTIVDLLSNVRVTGMRKVPKVKKTKTKTKPQSNKKAAAKAPRKPASAAKKTPKE